MSRTSDDVNATCIQGGRNNWDECRLLVDTVTCFIRLLALSRSRTAQNADIMAKQLFAPLRAAVVDGRTRTAFYRQTQLEKLHQGLTKNSSAIVDAIVADSGIAKAEAQAEYALALADVKERYAELNPKTELENEYAIANNKDAADLRTGVGIVYIQANSSHSVFYSIISPLSAAIAAGNCVILQVSKLCCN